MLNFPRAQPVTLTTAVVTAAAADAATRADRPRISRTAHTGDYIAGRPMAQAASRLAYALLGHEDDRWRHTCAVAARAGEAAATLAIPQRPLLLAAAWLHDVGYADSILEDEATANAVGTGFHPLDGADYLRRHRWPDDLTVLVAHHSGAEQVAAVLDLTQEMVAYGMLERLQATADVLTWADQTTGPGGQPWTLEQRLEDMLRRHGPDSPNARAHPARVLGLRSAVQRTEAARRAIHPGH